MIRFASVMALCCLAACATVPPPAPFEPTRIMSPGQANLNPILDRQFAPSDTPVIITSDKATFKRIYFGRKMEGIMHFRSSNVGADGQAAAFFDVKDADYLCNVNPEDIPVLLKWGSKPDLLVRGYMFYAISYRGAHGSVFLTGCDIRRIPSGS